MIRTVGFRLAVAVAIAMPLAFADSALAQKAKKLSYEQAWAQCKKELAAQGGPMTETAGSSGRYAAGGACLHKYGYRLKKKTAL